jgi:hypothetical protein
MFGRTPLRQDMPTEITGFTPLRMGAVTNSKTFEITAIPIQEEARMERDRLQKQGPKGTLAFDILRKAW